MTAAIVRLAALRPLWLSADHGHAEVSGMLVNARRVERIWWREGLKVPQKRENGYCESVRSKLRDELINATGPGMVFRAPRIGTIIGSVDS